MVLGAGVWRNGVLHTTQGCRPDQSGRTPSSEVQYAVLCCRDGKVRDISTPDRSKAVEWAASRDRECGMCYAEHHPHVVVSRTVTAWEPLTAPSSGGAE